MILLLITLALALVIGITVPRLILSALRPPAPFSYTHDVYVAEDAALCPGEALRWTPTFTVRDAGVVTIVRTYWNAETLQIAQTRDGKTVGTIDASRVFLPAHAGQARANAVVLTVPDLPAGSYVIATSARGVGTEQAVYVVYFAVEECS